MRAASAPLAGLTIPCHRASIEAIDQHGRYTRQCLLPAGHDGICRWSGWQPVDDAT